MVADFYLKTLANVPQEIDMILLMVQKSQTTWDVSKLVNRGIS